MAHFLSQGMILVKNFARCCTWAKPSFNLILFPLQLSFSIAQLNFLCKSDLLYLTKMLAPELNQLFLQHLDLSGVLLIWFNVDYS